ncbi:MAG: DUF4333 domain-containing protein, partial [Propionibacteriaceae bacterium]|nr:DUF4333 domain-containing protein [Propionibacteriaceae bacterium]
MVLFLGTFLIIGALIPGGTGGIPECPTDMMWSEEEGRCVSAWIIPSDPPLDDELVQPPADLAARLEVVLAEHNYGEHKVDCGTDELRIYLGAQFTCSSVKSSGSTHIVTVTITKVDVSADSYEYDVNIDDTQTPPETTPPTTTEPYPSKPKLEYKKQKASLKKFCNAFKYDDIYDGSGKISVNQAENILLLRDYEGSKHLER